MSRFDVLIVILTIAFSSAITFFLGSALGAYDRQQLIVQECKEEGLYLDRRLFLQCAVGEPEKRNKV